MGYTGIWKELIKFFQLKGLSPYKIIQMWSNRGSVYLSFICLNSTASSLFWWQNVNGKARPEPGKGTLQDHEEAALEDWYNVTQRLHQLQGTSDIRTKGRISQSTLLCDHSLLLAKVHTIHAARRPLKILCQSLWEVKLHFKKQCNFFMLLKEFVYFLYRFFHMVEESYIFYFKNCSTVVYWFWKMMHSFK